MKKTNFNATKLFSVFSKKNIVTTFVFLGLTGCTMTRLVSCEKPKFIEGSIKSGFTEPTAEEYKKIESNIVDTVRFAESLDEQKAIIAGWNDKIYIQRYLHGYNGTDLLNIKSVSKVFISLLFGILLDEGKITSLDVTAASFLPEYFNQFDKEDPKQKITLNHLLTMSSGLKRFFTYKEIPESEKDWVKYVLAQPMDFQPGEKFEYNCVNSHVLVAVLEKIVQKDIYDFLKDKVLNPLEFSDTRWDKDPTGRYQGGSNFYVKPADLLAIVRLIFNKGEYNGKRIVSEEWLKKSTSKAFDSVEASFIKIGYGTHWWTTESRDGKARAFFQSGLGGQMLHMTAEYNSFMILVFDVLPDAETTFESQQSNVANFFQLLYY